MEAVLALFLIHVPLFMKPCARHHTTKGERARVFDSSTEANLMPSLFSASVEVPQEDSTTLPHCDAWIQENSCSRDPLQEGCCPQLTHHLPSNMKSILLDTSSGDLLSRLTVSVYMLSFRWPPEDGLSDSQVKAQTGLTGNEALRTCVLSDLKLTHPGGSSALSQQYIVQDPGESAAHLTVLHASCTTLWV